MGLVKSFTFNLFQENTYIVYDETNECVIIDPGCSNTIEEKVITEFITINKLTPVKLLQTHCHIDHIMGVNYINSTYNLMPIMHPLEEFFIINSKVSADMYGIKLNAYPENYSFFDTEQITFGNTTMKIIFTPGHSPGSVSFINEKDNYCISGDVLFMESIGRSDLPFGNQSLLINSIKTKLYTLPDSMVVYSGHGEPTTIGHEKIYNPYVSI